MSEALQVEGPDGLRLHALVRPAPLAEPGPPILLLHGFAGSAASWGEPILDGLAGRHRVIAVDLPGHGRSDTSADPSCYRIEAIVERLAHLLGELGVPRAHWVGYSMGGRVALAAALLAPERVERLVLEGASPGLAGAAERQTRVEQDETLARRIEEQGIERFANEWQALPLFASRRRLPEPVREALRERLLQNDARALAACLRGLGTGSQPSFWDELGRVRAPTLLITGEDDVKFADIALRMASALPQCRHLRAPGAGHTVHLESPDVWLEAVSAWVD